MTILMLEPDEALRDVVRFILEREGYEVIEAEDGEAALQCLSTRRLALVLAEVKLPQLDGWELCRRIRAEYSTPVIIFSTADEPADLERGFALGAAAYLTKPFGADELIAVVGRVLARNRQYQCERSLP